MQSVERQVNVNAVFTIGKLKKIIKLAICPSVHLDFATKPRDIFVHVSLNISVIKVPGVGSGGPNSALGI